MALTPANLGASRISSGSGSSKNTTRGGGNSNLVSRALTVGGALAVLTNSGNEVEATSSFSPTIAPTIAPTYSPTSAPTSIRGNSNGEYPNCGNGWDSIKAYEYSPGETSLTKLLSYPESGSLYSMLETCEVNPYPELMDALKTVATLKTDNGTGNLYYSFQCSDFSLPLAPPKIVSECDAENGHVKGNLEYVNNVTSRVVVACDCPELFYNASSIRSVHVTENDVDGDKPKSEDVLNIDSIILYSGVGATSIALIVALAIRNSKNHMVLTQGDHLEEGGIELQEVNAAETIPVAVVAWPQGAASEPSEAGNVTIAGTNLTEKV